MPVTPNTGLPAVTDAQIPTKAQRASNEMLLQPHPDLGFNLIRAVFSNILGLEPISEQAEMLAQKFNCTNSRAIRLRGKSLLLQQIWLEWRIRRGSCHRPPTELSTGRFTLRSEARIPAASRTGMTGSCRVISQSFNVAATSPRFPLCGRGLVSVSRLLFPRLE